MMITDGVEIMPPQECTALPSPSSSPRDSGIQQLQMTREGPPTCVGCMQVILDEFILRVQGRLWHSSCLRCTVCQSSLKQACFARGNQVFCEKDFFMLFGVQCSGCGGGIPPTENVRRAHDNIYHVTCFTCVECNRQLDTGDEFYLRDDCRLICSQDYHRNKLTDDEELDDNNEKKGRSALSDAQTEVLKREFRFGAKPSRQRRERLGSEIGIDQRVVQVWFQNKRAKSKRHLIEMPCDGNNNDFSAPGMNCLKDGPIGGYPLPIVNGDYESARRLPPVKEFPPFPAFPMPTSGHEVQPWNATPDMWDMNFVPPNIDLSPTDITTNGEVCTARRGHSVCEDTEELINLQAMS